uniref:Interleukin-6 n=1 Tax=Podarcis muralis TaxID=64176 RepID=A0A670HL61_PODMU
SQQCTTMGPGQNLAAPHLAEPGPAYAEVLSSDKRILNLAIWLKLRTKRVFNDMCTELSTCDMYWEHVRSKELTLPEADAVQVCFPRGFDKETCLRRLARGLLVFRVYLEYLQKTLYPDKPELTNYLWPSTSRLVAAFKSMMNEPETSRTSVRLTLIRPLEVGLLKWRQNTLNSEEFMEANTTTSKIGMPPPSAEKTVCIYSTSHNALNPNDCLQQEK